MDNKILKSFEEFNKNTNEIAVSQFFAFAFAFVAGAEAEKKRIKKKLKKEYSVFGLDDNVLEDHINEILRG
ncbi:MAG: hypothetical protein E3J23_08540 [Candidatus Stahlbacteria bacterium]|nr:MAG: hypothetical protein E3J23_08540 [Candidatus Stahlbacteria bacterium]